MNLTDQLAWQCVRLEKRIGTHPEKRPDMSVGSSASHERDRGRNGELSRSADIARHDCRRRMN